MREQLKRIMAGVFNCAPEDVPDDADLDTLDAWDSLHHLELMLELEAEFALRIPAEAMAELVSLDRIEGYLHDRAVAS